MFGTPAAAVEKLIHHQLVQADKEAAVLVLLVIIAAALELQIQAAAVVVQCTQLLHPVLLALVVQALLFFVFYQQIGQAQ
jgi:hypothetical protein